MVQRLKMDNADEVEKLPRKIKSEGHKCYRTRFISVRFYSPCSSAPSSTSVVILPFYTKIPCQKTFFYLEKSVKSFGMKYAQTTLELQHYTVACLTSGVTQWKSFTIYLSMMHTLMSFLGCIRTVMKASGMEALLAVAFGGITNIVNSKSWINALHAYRMLVAIFQDLLKDDPQNLTPNEENNVKKGEIKKNDQQEAGLDQPSDSTEVVEPGNLSEEADPPNRAVYTCATIDVRLQTVYTVLRGELAPTKEELQTSIMALEKNVTSHANTIGELEKSASHQLDDVTALQRQVTRLSSVEKLTGKCEDLEGRSRRHNIRIIGVPKGTKGPKPRDFIAGLRQEILSLGEKPLIDRAHRTLQRPFVLRLHYFHTLEDILRKAAEAKQLYHGGKRIQIFPDYPPAVARKRALFNGTRELLRGRPGVRYGLLYPARLLIIHNDTQISFIDA
ncbi:hypothetical protein FQN60_004509 [Etheostoma spectabile]|uniref:L1 transposable element RRM domain-containing protein n=1 Tax=Etheostoma spectabile TaxID=54343 RepID=A0A5J5CDJ4_9PERO|nr:hypothetical protein FQN60_004509 [Etheostoma spectabile]